MFKYNPLVLVIPDDHKLLAIGKGSDKENEPIVITQGKKSSINNIGHIETRFASVLLGAISCFDLYHGSSSVNDKNILQMSLGFTNKWMNHEKNRISKPEKWDCTGEHKLDLSEAGRFESMIALKEKPFKECKNEWEQATKCVGCIRGSKKADKIEYRIELWRAMTEVDGYICMTDNKREALHRLVTELKLFRRRPRKRSRSCMVAAPPGSGKTYLVECLGESIGYDALLQFNITQLYSREALLACFDQISTTQARNPGKPLLVFFDEINAELEGRPVYDIFLAPIDSGVYVRAEKNFQIRPCFWIFASTEDSSNQKIVHGGDEKGTKYIDFKSRLDMEINLTEIRTEEADIEKLGIERVYTGVAILVKVFQDVREVSSQVLKILCNIGPCLTVRQFVYFIRSFKEIKRGRVSFENIPKDRLQRLVEEEEDRLIQMTATGKVHKKKLLEMLSKVKNEEIGGADIPVSIHP